ncbi:hypothetical protein [Brevibacillus fulvus]|uniref:Uncharacterized protein n=1 Tax=Brevibacillus fulvus TaxID=1125967 RepID=A0A939BWG5_9BACL|nr:hypothetical protein [Brevibacillus fulvus]MBM7591796.1 hypothetical protein [Brevibacillus fulvus]
MGFDQKAVKLIGKKVEVKMFNGSIISGTMTHYNKGYICFTFKTADQEKTTIRRLPLRDITSMVELKR